MFTPHLLKPSLIVSSIVPISTYSKKAFNKAQLMAVYFARLIDSLILLIIFTFKLTKCQFYTLLFLSSGHDIT